MTGIQTIAATLSLLAVWIAFCYSFKTIYDLKTRVLKLEASLRAVVKSANTCVEELNDSVHSLKQDIGAQKARITKLVRAPRVKPVKLISDSVPGPVAEVVPEPPADPAQEDRLDSDRLI